MPGKAKAPSAPPQVDAAALEAKQAWRAKRAALLERMRKLSPALFGYPPVPLMIGVDRVLFDRLDLTEADRRMLSVNLNLMVRRPSYLKAMLVEGAQRCDLNGNPVEPVSEEHRKGARSLLDTLTRKAKMKAKKPTGIDRTP